MILTSKACLLFFFLVYVSISHQYGDDFTCDHDKIEQNPEFLDIEEDNSFAEEGRLLQSTANYPQIRLYPYFEPLNKSSPKVYADYIQELVSAVFDYFQAAIKIKYPVSGTLKLSSSVTKICQISTPSILKTTGVAADMFVYFDSYADSSYQIANSMYCYLASGTKRPLVARTVFNRNMFLNPNGNAVIHERNTYLLIHEMFHNFGFSGYNYNYYLDANGKTLTGHVKSARIAGKTRQVLDLPPLTQRLRNYYGCSTLPGAILEDSGSSSTASSHFERKYFIFETMSSGNMAGERISEFSLALMEGTGWYIPDYRYAEPYFVGKGKGCNFISATCSSSRAPFSEYCTGSSRACNAGGRGGGYCESDSISDSCRYVWAYDENDCENEDAVDYARFPDLEAYGRGAGSRCFNGDLTTRRSGSTRTYFCFKYTCVGSGISTQLQVRVGTNTITCTKAEKKTVSGYNGSIDCPDPQTFCSTVGQQYCPRNCMGRGTCVNNKCTCKSGYTGTDCALIKA